MLWLVRNRRTIDKAFDARANCGMNVGSNPNHAAVTAGTSMAIPLERSDYLRLGKNRRERLGAFRVGYAVARDAMHQCDTYEACCEYAERRLKQEYGFWEVIVIQIVIKIALYLIQKWWERRQKDPAFMPGVRIELEDLPDMPEDEDD